MIDTATETLFTPQESLLRRWRLDQLVRHGYPLAHALILAVDPDVDLELARRLARLGCPSALAMRILATET